MWLLTTFQHPRQHSNVNLCSFLSFLPPPPFSHVTHRKGLGPRLASASLVPRPPESEVQLVDFFWYCEIVLGITNQIAARHTSRKCHMIYAQAHLTSTHEYVTELGKRRRGRSLFCCTVYSIYGRWEVDGTRY